MKANFDLEPLQWAALRRLLDAALALAPAERDGWLERLGAEQEALKPRLRRLLAHAAGGDSPLDSLPQVETAQFLAEGARRSGEEGLRTGASVGPYRLIRPLGAGGMGEVWLAERTDMLHKRPVALKLPRLLAARAVLAERLAREREILAALNHPNIARLYDAGISADGQPYLALEYVEGERLDAYCSRRGLEVPAKLRLFLQVARAVAHAHAQLVVHRDLKPANILVTAAAEVKLLDFGIAKLLDDGQARETELTQLAGRALTPEYAAPEQILGQPLGTAADVYALGVVLFELLTGSRPYRLKRDSRAALEEAIATAEPARPSSVAAEPKLRKRLRGDLDTIVLQALKKAPAERYGTVQALAEDIERHLEQRPVRAQPDRRTYRLRKFVARNRLAVGAAAAVLLAIVTGAGVALWQTHEAKIEQRRADEVLTFITSIFRESDPWIGPQNKPSAGDLLVRARARVDDQFAALSPTRVELLCVLAESLLGVQDNDAANEAANAALREAEKLFGPGHAQALRARHVLARVHRNRGDTKDMRKQVEWIIERLQAQPKPDPQRLIAALTDRAELELDETKYEQAETTAREILRLAPQASGNREMVRATAWKLISGGLEARMLYSQATDAAQQSLRHAQAAHELQPRHPQLVNARLLYGRLLAVGERFKEALALIQQSADDVLATYGPGSRAYGQALQNLAVNQARAADLDSALSNAERALAILETHYGPDGGHTGAAIDALAFVHFSARRPAKAIALYDRVLPIIEKNYGPRAEHSYPSRMRRAASLAFAGRFDEALPELKRVAEEYARVGKGSMTRPWHHLGIAERLAGRPAAALQLQRQALEAIRDGPSAARERQPVQAEIGISLIELDRADEAIAAIEPVLKAWDRDLLRPTPARADAAIAIGRAWLKKGDASSAYTYLAQANDFWQQWEPEGRWAGEAAFWLARAYESLGRGSEAEAADTRAARLLARSPIPADAKLVELARQAVRGRVRPGA